MEIKMEIKPNGELKITADDLSEKEKAAIQAIYALVSFHGMDIKWGARLLFDIFEGRVDYNELLELLREIVTPVPARLYHGG